METVQLTSVPHTKSILLSDKQQRDEWYTPPEIIQALGKFDLDPACGPQCSFTTATERFGPDQDGLKQPWHGRVWLNPPFSNARPWVDKLAEHKNGILLTFVRSDAMWFQKAVISGGGLFMFSGRTEFRRPSGMAGRCPLGCCLIPFGSLNRWAIIKSSLRGIWLNIGSYNIN